MPTYGHSRFYKRSGGAGALARRRRGKRMAALRSRRMSRMEVKSIARRVVSRSSETHERTQSASLGSVTSTGSLTRLSQIGQGDGDDDRQGDDVRATYLRVAVVGQGSTTSGASPTNPTRIMIVRSKKRYDSSALTAGDMPAYYSLLTNDDKEKFDVLYDSRFHAKSIMHKAYNGSGISTSNLGVQFERQIRRKLTHLIRWDDANTTSSDAAIVGDVYLWVTCRESVAGLEGVVYEASLQYKDK